MSKSRSIRSLAYISPLLGSLLWGCLTSVPPRESPAPPIVETDREPPPEDPWTEADARAVEEMREAFAENAAPGAAALGGAAEETAVPASRHLLRVHVFDLGQADAMLVIGPPPECRTLLVDLGEPTRNSRLPPSLRSSALHVRDRIEALTGRSGVDYFVATHYHSDHLGYGKSRADGWWTGIIQLLSDFAIDFSVGSFIHVGEAGAGYLAGADRRGVYRTIRERMPVWERYGRVGRSEAPRFGSGQIDLGPDVKVDILAFACTVQGGASAFARAEQVGVDYTRTPGDENDLSVAFQVTAGDFELFTAGDLNGTDDPASHPLYVLRDFGQVYTNIEHHMVDHWASTGRETDVEIYRANHHGSGYSTTARLLDAFDPEFVLYSTGADHGHPSRVVVDRVADTARQLATTAVRDPADFTAHRGERVGEIEIVVAEDGKSYTINGETHLAFDDAAEAAGDDQGEEEIQH